MKFCATRAAPDGEYNEVFEANSWDDAQAYCEARGWTLDGEVKMSVPAIVGWWVPLWCAVRNFFRRAP